MQDETNAAAVAAVFGTCAANTIDEPKEGKEEDHGFHEQQQQICLPEEPTCFIDQQEVEDDSKPPRDDTAMIAEATAAAISAAVNAQVDADAVDTAVLVAASAANLVDAADVPTIPRDLRERRKRYREKTVERKVMKDSPTADRPQKQMAYSANNSGTTPSSKEEELATRRLKDRERYAKMTEEEREAYNSRRRQHYHKQTEDSRQRRRERERQRYHNLTQDDAKDRNARRARLERERYQRLPTEDLEARNRRRRERAALKRQQMLAQKAQASNDVPLAQEHQTSTLADDGTSGNEQKDLDSHSGAIEEEYIYPVVEAVLVDVPLVYGEGTSQTTAPDYDLTEN